MNLLPTYNFFLANLPDDNLLTVQRSSAITGSTFTASIDIDGLLANTVDIFVNDMGDVNFNAHIARASSRFDLIVASGGVDPLEGTIAVNVTEDIMFGPMGGTVGTPLSGVFTVVTPAETVRVVATATLGVEISLNGNEPVIYTWDELKSLFDDETQETWLRRASLAAAAIDFLYGQFFDVADILDDLELVTLTNPLVESCDMFTGSPPDGVLAQGEVSVTWTGSGELSDGDDFNWEFNQCWFDEPNRDAPDELLDGTIVLQDYTETVDFDTNTLFEIGFGGTSGQPGGVIFDLTVSETVEDNGVFTISDVMLISGGFAMIIQSP